MQIGSPLNSRTEKRTLPSFFLDVPSSRVGASLAPMQSKHLLLFLVMLAKPCAAQVCMKEVQPQGNIEAVVSK